MYRYSRASTLVFMLCAVAACGAATRGIPEIQAQANRPNVILVVVDDLGWIDLGYSGSSFYETPAIDRLASESMQFSAAYAASPVCSPTRASLMTGQDPARVRITDWIPGVDPRNRKLLGPVDLHELPLATTTIAERFKADGYKTFYAGKWHLGGEGFHPDMQGFDINMGGHHKGSPPGGYYSPYKNPYLSDGPEGEYLTDRLTNETIEFMAENRDSPFFAMLAFYTVHQPIEASKRHIEYYEKKAAQFDDLGGKSHVAEHGAMTKLRQDSPAYASMVAAMDENVGKLLSSLEELGLSENTIVVFTSDNGGLSAKANPRGRLHNVTSNLPLRAGKGWLYEGGIRIPLVIRAPGLTSTGMLSAEPVMTTDLMPTLLDLAGIDARDAAFDGRSLRPLLAGKADLERDALYFYFPHYHASGNLPSAAVRAGRWKLIHFFESGVAELYALDTDPGEANDLSAKMPGKVRELEAQLFAWLEEVAAQLPVTNPAY